MTDLLLDDDDGGTPGEEADINKPRSRSVCNRSLEEWGHTCPVNTLYGTPSSLTYFSFPGMTNWHVSDRNVVSPVLMLIEVAVCLALLLEPWYTTLDSPVFSSMKSMSLQKVPGGVLQVRVFTTTRVEVKKLFSRSTVISFWLQLNVSNIEASLSFPMREGSVLENTTSKGMRLDDGIGIKVDDFSAGVVEWPPSFFSSITALRMNSSPTLHARTHLLPPNHFEGVYTGPWKVLSLKSDPGLTSMMRYWLSCCPNGSSVNARILSVPSQHRLWWFLVHASVACVLMTPRVAPMVTTEDQNTPLFRMKVRSGFRIHFWPMSLTTSWVTSVPQFGVAAAAVGGCGAAGVVVVVVVAGFRDQGFRLGS
ncbi:hypothetical protein Pelo_9313 [Pelomyxa schiedti]|nr:hypothetical protein Pelo_9313 [Pelomyxa schiedti]